MCFNFKLCSQSINIVTNTHHCRSTKLKEIRARASNPNTLLLDGGDQFQGTFWFYVYKGMAAAQFMKKLGYDAMVCEIPLDIIVILFSVIETNTRVTLSQVHCKTAVNSLVDMN